LARPKKEKVTLPVEVRAEIARAFDEQFKIHSGQQQLHDQVFVFGKKRIFAQCGRNWGKSVDDAHIAAKFAGLNPGSHCYIILPEKTQAKEIFWDTGLLKGMIPPKYILKNIANRDSTIKSELRILLTNGSFIKLLGADDPDSLRGIKPHFCIYDEYRDFKSDVYWSMEANLLGKNATLIVTSTPPDVVGHYSELRQHFLNEVNRGNDMYYYMELPTETNPHIDKKMLMDIKRRLVAHGQLRVWEREYMAKFIPGGASSVFPMFAERKDELVKSSMLVEELVKNDKEVIEFHALFDPASSSVFAVLFCAVNKFTGQVFVLDEIYERDRTKTSSIDIWKRANEVKVNYYKKLVSWENTYDEHESWFLRDLERYQILDEEGTSLNPTTKQSRDKQEDLAIIKDLMLSTNRFFISQKCHNLIEEIESYATDKDGKIVKKKDHLLDCLRYLIPASDFKLDEQPNYQAYIELKAESKDMSDSFETFIKKRREQEDWTTGLDENSVLTDEVIYLEDLGYADLF
jgi:hypothetical protein